MSTTITDAPIPPWATGRACGAFIEIGAQLCTKDGRIIGNAVVVELDERLIGDVAKPVARIITDIGTSLVLTENELKEFFHAPEWTMDVSRFKAILAAREKC